MSDDGLTDRQAEILEELNGFLDEHKGQPPGFVTCGTIAGLLGYRGTSECPSGRIAGGVMGRLYKKGLVDKSDIGQGKTESEQMTVSYRPSIKGKRLLREYHGEAVDDDQGTHRYWVSWYTRGSCWGFPWHWRSGYSGDRVIVVALIAARSEQEAWDKASWVAHIDDKRFINEVDDDYRPSGRFPPTDWWPEPEVVWSHLSEEGYQREFWEDIKGRED